MIDESAQTLPGGAIPPTIRGRYRVERVLGAGGMGEVLLAEDTELRRRVAIKKIRPEMSRDEKLRKRIERECLLHAKVGAHPHIVTLFDKFEENGQIHLVMEYVEGETLQALIEAHRKAGTTLPRVEALSVAAQVLDALSRIHAHGIVHRDIKPDNAIVARDDSGAYCAKLMDFGIARVSDAEEGATRLTQAGSGGPGTPRYMAPEQIDPNAFGDTTAAADIYAMGVALYELLTGDAPFVGSVTSVWMGHLAQPPPPMNLEPRSSFNVALEAVVARALAKYPSDRFASAREFRDELHRLAASAETQPDAASAARRSAAIPPRSAPEDAGAPPPLPPGRPGAPSSEEAPPPLPGRSDARGSAAIPPLPARPAPAPGLRVAAREAEARGNRAVLAIVAGVAFGLLLVGGGVFALIAFVGGKIGGGEPARPAASPTPFPARETPTRDAPKIPPPAPRREGTNAEPPVSKEPGDAAPARTPRQPETTPPARRETTPAPESTPRRETTTPAPAPATPRATPRPARTDPPPAATPRRTSEPPATPRATPRPVATAPPTADSVRDAWGDTEIRRPEN